MSGKAIGIGVAVLLFLVVLYFVFSGDDTSNAVAEGEEVPEPEVNDPPCSEFECGEGLETKDGELGTTSQQCCQKPLCPTDICSANNVEFKDPIENARGDTLDECCQDALCSLEKCSVGYKLSGNRLGRTNAECCIEKPLCFPSDGTEPHFPCPEDTHTKKDETTKGSTKDECCTSKTCQENLWGVACAARGLSPKENLGAILGYTSDVCCQQPLCSEASGITCPEGKKIDPDSDLRGSDAESCCVPKTCDENEWGGESFVKDKTTIELNKCKFYSDQTKSPKDDLGNISGNSVEECCEEKLCSNHFFYDNRCTDTIEVTSPCFKLGNMIPGLPLSVGNLKKNCASVRQDGDASADDGAPPAGKKLAPDGTLMPVTGNAIDTCCVSLTCGELKDKNPNIANCGAEGVFNPDGISDISSEDGSENPCCSSSTCAEAYQGTDKCADPDTYGKNIVFEYSRYGGDDKVSVNVENMKYDITKGTSPAGPGCCVPKTCADLGFNDEKCRSKSGGEKLSDPNKASNFVEGDGVTSCCREKPCSQQTEEELNQMCGWNMTKKSVLPTEGEGTAETCCEYKTCADIEWDDAKCKDREYTRASFRGKARKGADGESLTLDDTSKTDETGTKWKAESAKINTEAGFEGDKYCCEQDLEDNFARMCVGNEWLQGSISNLSPGVNITQGDGHPITPVPGQNYDSYYGKTNEQCMNTCKADDRCTSFTLGANTNHVKRFWDTKHPAPHTQEKPSCKLYQKLGSSVNVNNLITSEWGLKRTTLQYFSGKTFPEEYRYSGGEIEVGNNKLLTGNDKAIGEKWSNDENGNKHGSYSGRPPRHTATTIAWGGGSDEAPYNDHRKRKEIYLAGVDREFCPVDFVKKYGTWRDNGSTDTAGTWHGESSEALDMLSESDGMWTGEKRNISASNGCSINTSVSSNLDDCYRNLNCGWSWITPVAGVYDGSRETKQGDKGSSGVYMSTINSQTLSDRGRTFCHKKNINKDAATPPRHMPDGGASVAPTRMITVDGDKIKLKFGVMPDKNPKADGYWKNMVITSIGDSSQAD
jgi:hypothetical protein